jgi:acyl-CoA dehydrogenase
MDNIGPDLLEQIFDVMIRDFSEFALKLYAKSVTTQTQMDFCMAMIQKPVTDTARFDRIWETHVMALKDTYDMTP